jgi:hypothetical protein
LLSYNGLAPPIPGKESTFQGESLMTVGSKMKATGKAVKTATKKVARKAGKGVKSIKETVTGNSAKKPARAKKSTAAKKTAPKKR